MINIELTKEELEFLFIMLDRTNLVGNEVTKFVNVHNKLSIGLTDYKNKNS